MKLITEMNQDIKFLTEKKEDGTKSVYIEGIFMQAEKPNRNGRMYGRVIMEREVQKYQELIKRIQKVHSLKN